MGIGKRGRCRHNSERGFCSKCDREGYSDGNEARDATEGVFKNGKAPKERAEYTKSKKIGPLLIEYGKKR